MIAILPYALFPTGPEDWKDWLLLPSLHWFCKHDNQWHTYEEMHEMMKQGIEFSYSNYDHRITCIRKLKRWIRKNPQFKNFVFFMSHVYLGHSVTVTAKVK